ncbi:HIT family protein [Anaerorhabdus furcosa]|uniref:Diadenosine tetraphosphate (Ap4A) hydrolase n=1 Tax=Anaerorhabdus furcosa TaxID=118967 RepID=A0A1T4PJN9_9FIRM|nr:hypothetical protein [Anaerorhabdus furcosa]SJZ91785.1 Diadenosine tetraphosphate (Ap4A) hydrolase [Anaerorhabdus furcosa]
MNNNIIEEKSNILKDFLGNEFKTNCIGCAIANHAIEIPGGLIFENEKFTIQQDPLIPINGFIIVNAKAHVNSINNLNKEDRSELIELINNVIIFLKELDVVEKITILQEEQSSHLHFWIFPQLEWMKQDSKRINNIREICKYAQLNATEKDKYEILVTVKKLKSKFKVKYHPTDKE